MLVLTRCKEDRITVTHAGETLTIVVCEIRGKSSGRTKVRLGFDGPPSFNVVRDDMKKGKSDE